jgi:predicted enzyme related to lactoylglutathione lyase
MTEVTRHEPGSFAWVELATSDPAAAKAFYTALFGWEAADTPAGPDMIYTMLRLRGLDVGALYPQDKAEAEHGVPPHWNVYVAVESADRAAARAKELGGKLLMEPFDVMEHGRMAIVQDPTGGVICCWEARKHLGARLVNEPGALCWGELYTTDTKKAGAFYSQLFGWTLKESPRYTEFHRGGAGVGGMMAIEASWGPVPPHWMPYFQVGELDATADKGRALGGKIHMPPQDIPEVGRFAILNDPQGAVFALIRVDRPDRA